MGVEVSLYWWICNLKHCNNIADYLPQNEHGCHPQLQFLQVSDPVLQPFIFIYRV